MGEIAEMMLDGFMCEQCGETIGDEETGEGQGFPGLCAGCAGEQRPSRKDNRGINASPKPFGCPGCKKRFRSQTAVDQHRRDIKH